MAKTNKNNIFRILGIERNEKTHTKFLAWIIGNDEWNKNPDISPVIKLLRIGLQRAMQQDKVSEFEKSNNSGDSLYSILSKDMLHFEPKEIKTEKRIREVQIDGTEGVVDLHIKGLLQGIDKAVPIRIILENKIDNGEHDHQTWKYYIYYTGDEEGAESLRKQGIEVHFNQKFGCNQGERYYCPKYDDELQVFIFLTPHSQDDMQSLYSEDNGIKKDKSSKSLFECPYFIHINYQDLYEQMLQPLVDSEKVNEDSRSKIEEYIDVLCSEPGQECNSKTKIMVKKAIDTSFNPTPDCEYNSIPDLGEFLQDEKEREYIEVNKIKRNKIKSDSTKYQIQYYKGNKEFIKETNQRNLLGELVKDYMERFNASREDVQNLFSNKINDIFVDDNNSGYVEINVCGTKYKISDQRARNPEYRQKIIEIFGNKGYKVSPT